MASISSSPSSPPPPIHAPSPTTTRRLFLLPAADPKALNPLLRWSHRSTIRCRSGTAIPPGSGDNDNKAVLDAFFLGKAFAEALNERIESAVGEFLSVVGQWQAETRKEVMEFQEEVAERAKRAKEKAAFEAKEGHGFTIKPPPDPIMYTRTAGPGDEAIDPLQDILQE